MEPRLETQGNPGAGEGQMSTEGQQPNENQKNNPASEKSDTNSVAASDKFVLTDIITRFMKLVERDKTAYFLYNVDSTPQPEGGPSAWGAAALMSAVDEGLAGINNIGVNYDKIFFAPKFPVTYYTELRYITGYEVSGTMVDVRYILKDEGMRYDVYSPAKKIKAHIFIPKSKFCSKLYVDSKETSFERVVVGTSKYIDFNISDIKDGKVSIEVLF